MISVTLHFLSSATLTYEPLCHFRPRNPAYTFASKVSNHSTTYQLPTDNSLGAPNNGHAIDMAYWV
jgi:hypothetical protein